jgi:hypothetical protein
MGKTYKEQKNYDYLHDNKPVSNKDYAKMKKRWNKINFGSSKQEKIKKKYKHYEEEE